MTLYTIFSACSYFLYGIRIAILLYCVLSWLRPANRFFYALEKFVMPFIAPFRRLSVWISSRTNLPLDFSCWFSLIGLTVVERILWWIYGMLAMIR